MVMRDTSFSAFSVIFVFFYMIFHLRSLFLSATGIFMILLSFPITTVITEGLIRITYFSSLHTLTVFIVLGVAADNIFVFYDAWRQSAHINPSILNNRYKRMAYAWRRAVRAIAVTSSTTAVAFFANVFSPLMPIKAFGVFAGMIIPVNYLLMIFIFPPAVIFYEDKIQSITCCKPKDNNKVETFNQEDLQKEISMFEKIENFFGTSWNSMVKKLRFPILLLFAIWLTIAVIFASRIGPLTKEEEFIPKYHPNIRAWTIFGESFTAQEEKSKNISVSLAWGLQDIDREGENPWDPYFIGKIIFDDEFDFTKSKS